jgi:hypothetical protein
LWAYRGELRAPDAQKGDAFGFSLALTATHLAVGAVGVDIGDATLAGAVYVFRRVKVDWASILANVP